MEKYRSEHRKIQKIIYPCYADSASTVGTVVMSVHLYIWLSAQYLNSK